VTGGIRERDLMTSKMTANRMKSRPFRAAVTVVAAVAVAIVAGGAKKGEPGVRELGKVKPKELVEISGIAASRSNLGVLWVSNDGDSGWLYAIRTSGKLAAAVKVPGRVVDTEEIAIGVGPKTGTDYIYVGDIGDNDSRRFEVAVIRFPEPSVNGGASVSIDAAASEVFRLTYPDGAHDAEALFIDPTTGTLYVVTKEARGARLYEIAGDELRAGERSILRFAADIEADNVSAGAISADGSQVLLRREDQGWLWRRQLGQSLAEALQAPPQSVRVLGRRQGKNGEAISFRPDGACYYTLSEGKKQSICEFDISAPESAASR
jgi:hypothetical protein